MYLININCFFLLVKKKIVYSKQRVKHYLTANVIIRICFFFYIQRSFIYNKS